MRGERREERNGSLSSDINVKGTERSACSVPV